MGNGTIEEGWQSTVEWERLAEWASLKVQELVPWRVEEEVTEFLVEGDRSGGA